MYKEPCARFIRSMMPKISVKPAANKNNNMPNCNPFNVCSKRRIQFTSAYFCQCDQKSKKGDVEEFYKLPTLEIKSYHDILQSFA